ncbi:uncharacterized protein LOC141716863 [Apium graveolens]|uniref:uncharacterized protein LOC141716863 n=1 Tax=Apium graveolens TaxID=4045 RepID=UPI003D7BAA90
MRALVKLYSLKAKHGIYDKCFSDVLLLLASMLPEGNNMPSSFGEAKKTLCTLGMNYEKIHVCPNDCLLYRGERDEDETICRICEASRWKLNKKGEEVKGIPAKVLWYFPLIPRLRNLLNTTQIAKDMTWHKTERQNDGKIRHPADSKTWKDVDQRWPEFAAEARNLRDYPALGNLSGNIIKGYNACVVCVDKTKPTRLATYKKTVVMRHRRWLPRNHPYRRQKSAFDNTLEKLSAPIPLTGEEVLERLEYWKFLPVRHTLDVMHIEKNICEALTSILLNISGKTKDRESVRIDMAEMGIGMELRPKNPGKKEKLPMASWNLLHKEKKIVCSSLIDMKLPDDFCSNLMGIVSMDTLRLAICSKVIEGDKLEKMQSQLVETLCQLEKHFPHSLFDVMIHLSVHLVREVELCGPVFLRWMYPFERYMKTFKGYVRNRAHPEGCIAEAYIAEEAIECLVNFEEPAVGLPGRDKNKEKYRPLSGAIMIKPSIKDLHQAHLCLLQNSNELTPYFNEHMAFLVARYPLHENDEEWLKNKQNETFPNWFQKKGKDKNIEHISHTFYGVITNKFDDPSDDENEGSVEIELENEVDVTMFPTVDEVEEENSSYMREEEEMIQLP